MDYKFVLEHMADYIEKKASSFGLQMLFLLTTRTADWYVILILVFIKALQ